LPQPVPLVTPSVLRALRPPPPLMFCRVDFVLLLHVLLFFFQAEDGILDFHVTGVQTCALPISCCTKPPGGHRPDRCDRSGQSGRSEERRVGKVRKFWLSPNHLKKKYLRLQRYANNTRIYRRIFSHAG